MVVSQPQLARRAQHPVRSLPAHLACADLEVAGQGGADRRQRYEVTDGEVEGAADDLQSFAEYYPKTEKTLPCDMLQLSECRVDYLHQICEEVVELVVLLAGLNVAGSLH